MVLANIDRVFVRRSARLSRKQDVSFKQPKIGPSVTSLRSIFTPKRRKRRVLRAEDGSFLATSTPNRNLLRSVRVGQIQSAIKTKIGRSIESGASRKGEGKKERETIGRRAKKETSEQMKVFSPQRKTPSLSADFGQEDPTQVEVDGSYVPEGNISRSTFEVPKVAKRAKSQPKNRFKPSKGAGRAGYKKVDNKVLASLRPKQRPESKKPVVPRQLAEYGRTKRPKNAETNITPVKVAPKHPLPVLPSLPKVATAAAPHSTREAAGNEARPCKPDTTKSTETSHRDIQHTEKPSTGARTSAELPAENPSKSLTEICPITPAKIRSLYQQLLAKCAPGADPLNLLRPARRCWCGLAR